MLGTYIESDAVDGKDHIRKGAIQPGDVGRLVALGPDGFLPPALTGDGAFPGRALASGVHLVSVPNGAFEDGLAGWTASHTGTGLVQVDGSTSITGVNSLRLTCAASSDTAGFGSAAPMPLGEGIPHRFALRCKLFSGGASIALSVSFYDSTKTIIGTPQPVAIEAISPPSAFTELGGILTPPSGTRYAAVGVKASLPSGQSAGVVSVDEVRVTRLDGFTDGIDPFPTPLIVRDRNWMWLTDASISGNGTSDDTAAVQKQVNKANAAGRTLLIPDNIAIRTTAPILCAGSTRIEGKGFDYYVNPTARPHTAGLGSLFIPDHMGQFLTIGPAAGVQAASGHRLRNFGIRRNQPAPVAGQVWTPLAHDWDITFAAGSGVVEGVVPLCSTNFCNLNYCNQMVFDRIFGQVFKQGIQITSAYDTVRLKSVGFLPMWSNAPEVFRYQRENLIGLALLRADNPMIDDLFVNIARFGIAFYKFTGDAAGHPAGVASKLQLRCLDADSCRTAIYTDPSAADPTTNIGPTAYFGSVQHDAGGANFSGTSYPNDSALFHSLAMNAPNSRFDFGRYQASNINGSMISCNGQGSYCHVETMVEGSFNGIATYFGQSAQRNPGIVTDTSAVVTVGDWRSSTFTERNYSTYPAGNSGAPRASGRVKAMLGFGTVQGTTDANGAISYPHGAGQVPTSMRVFGAQGGQAVTEAFAVSWDATVANYVFFERTTGARLGNANVAAAFEAVAHF